MANASVGCDTVELHTAGRLILSLSGGASNNGNSLAISDPSACYFAALGDVVVIFLDRVIANFSVRFHQISLRRYESLQAIPESKCVLVVGLGLINGGKSAGYFRPNATVGGLCRSRGRSRRLR